MFRARFLNIGRGLDRPNNLRRQLVGTSLAVALVSIVLLAVVTLVIADTDLGNAGRDQETTTTNLFISTLRTTYQAPNGWSPSTLAAIASLAHNIGFGLEVNVGARRVLDVATSQTEGQSRSFPLVVSGTRIGTATLQFPTSGLSLGEARLRRSIGEAVATAAVLAILVALIAAAISSRRLIIPVRLLTAASRRLGTGDLTSRVGDISAPSEIKELANSFDTMANHIEEGDKLRRALVADLAHELRTPLAILQAELEALAEGVEELTQAAVVSLGEEVNRLSRLVEDLEVLAATEAALMSLEKERIDLSHVAGSAAMRLESQFLEKSIRFVTSFTPAFVIADPRRVEQMVTNLLSNAAKFTGAGGEVKLSVTRDRGYALLVVSDSGVGIAPDEQPKVFERFFRGQRSHGTSGSGIGLAVVSELVAAHGGSVTLESAPGIGTSVTIRLRLT